MRAAKIFYYSLDGVVFRTGYSPGLIQTQERTNETYQ